MNLIQMVRGIRSNSGLPVLEGSPTPDTIFRQQVRELQTMLEVVAKRSQSFSNEELSEMAYGVKKLQGCLTFVRTQAGV